MTVVSDIEYILHAECDTPSLMWRYVGEDIIRKERMPSVPIVLDILFVSKSLHVQHPLNMLPNLIRVPEPHLIRQAKEFIIFARWIVAEVCTKLLVELIWLFDEDIYELQKLVVDIADEVLF